MDEAQTRLWWFLTILSNMGGSTDASGNGDNWINTFCEDVEGRVPDTFNIAAKVGYTRVTHNDITESSKVYITAAGRQFLAAFEPPLTTQPKSSYSDRDVDVLFATIKQFVLTAGFGGDLKDLAVALDRFQTEIKLWKVKRR